MQPFLDTFYYGYMLTKDTKWIDKEIEWADALINRGVKEPDGYIGWPSTNAGDTKVDGLDQFDTDSMVADAMVLRPIVLLSKEILTTPATCGGEVWREGGGLHQILRKDLRKMGQPRRLAGKQGQGAGSGLPSSAASMVTARIGARVRSATMPGRDLPSRTIRRTRSGRRMLAMFDVGQTGLQRAVKNGSPTSGRRSR